MVDNTSFLPGLSPVAGKAVVARFDGGRPSSEGRLLVLREVERRLGLAGRLAECLTDRRALVVPPVPSLHYGRQNTAGTNQGAETGMAATVVGRRAIVIGAGIGGL